MMAVSGMTLVTRAGKVMRSVMTMTTPDLEDTSDLMDAHSDPTKRTNPFDLHWRTRGPKWTGNLDVAWNGKYAHLEGEVYCRYCGAIPCPMDHDEEKLSRLKDLEFVRDIVKDKKDLEKNYEKLDQNMKQLIEDTKGWRAEKAMLLDQLKLAEKRKEEWDFERRLMEAEMNRLKALNDRQFGQLADFKKEQQKMVALNAKLKRVEEENEKLTNEVQKVRQLLVSQMDLTEREKKQKQQVTIDLEASEARGRVLTVQLDEALEEKIDAQKALADYKTRMQNVEEEMKKLLEELNLRTRNFEAKENLSQMLIRELRSQMLEMKGRLEESEQDQADLQQQLAAYLREIEQLRQRLASDKRFRKFVEIKRVCNDLRDENEALKSRTYRQLAHAHSIPVLNANGRVTSPIGRLSSAPLEMRRAKSASVFASNERLYSVRKIRDALKLETPVT